VQVHVDVLVIESDDVATAVAEEVARDAITKLVLGASSSGIFKRYLLKCHYHIKYHFQKSEELLHYLEHLRVEVG